MSIGWGKSRRLEKLKKNNYYLLFAMDHSLTSGPILGIETVQKVNNWINFAEKNQIPGIVLNLMYTYKLDVFHKTNLVTQTMGLPDSTEYKINKVPLARVKDLVLVDSTAVSVQIDFNTNNLQETIQNISKIVHEANKYQYPVLFMVNNKKWDNYKDFNYAVRICSELGADLIKIRLPSESIPKDIDQFIETTPPLLLSGGEISNEFETEVRVAKNLGFQGACIGRNIFQHPNPIEILNIIDKVFNDG